MIRQNEFTSCSAGDKIGKLLKYALHFNLKGFEKNIITL